MRRIFRVRVNTKARNRDLEQLAADESRRREMGSDEFARRHAKARELQAEIKRKGWRSSMGDFAPTQGMVSGSGPVLSDGAKLYVQAFVDGEVELNTREGPMPRDRWSYGRGKIPTTSQAAKWAERKLGL